MILTLLPRHLFPPSPKSLIQSTISRPPLLPSQPKLPKLPKLPATTRTLVIIAKKLSRLSLLNSPQNLTHPLTNASTNQTVAHHHLHQLPKSLHLNTPPPLPRIFNKKLFSTPSLCRFLGADVWNKRQKRIKIPAHFS